MTVPAELVEEPVDRHFVETVAAWPAGPAGSERRRRSPHEPLREGTTLTGELALALFEAQLGSRHL
ncbi:MAG: hypothetical protein ACRD0L_15325, partial [Acidimicrobiales bacterium]